MNGRRPYARVGQVDIRLSGHLAYRTEYHIVWITKYRRRLLNPGMAGYLSKLLPRVLDRMPGVQIVEKSIQIDHVHIVMIIPPKYRVSDVVAEIKQYTAMWMRKKFAFMKKVYWKEQVPWSPGYFVSTVGINESTIIKYVKFQQRQDSGQAKLEWR